MHRTLSESCFALLGVVLIQAAFASDPQDPKHPCSVVHDAAERLACYDAQFGTPADVDDAPVTLANAARARKDFGLSESQRRARTPESDRHVFPDRIEAVVMNVRRQATGEMVVALDNEQVWIQAEPVTSARLRVGDTVIIRKAALGSYQLVTPQSIAMRVRRLR